VDVFVVVFVADATDDARARLLSTSVRRDRRLRRIVGAGANESVDELDAHRAFIAAEPRQRVSREAPM